MKSYFLFRRAFRATIVLSMAAGCGRLTFDDPTESSSLPNSPADPRVQPTEAPEFSAALSELPEPNRFEVALRWKAMPGVSAIVIKRKDTKGHTSQLDLLPGSATTYVDSSPEPRNRYTYSVVGMKDGNVFPSQGVVVETPLDLEVSGAVDWPASEITGINRLFLHKDSRLRTLGRDFRIDVRAIIAEDAVIESFPEGRAAGRGSPGASGGTLDLKAQVGTGSLLIFARGENGGSGSPGGRGAMGPQGGRGSDGVADYEMDCMLRMPFKLFESHHCFKHWYCKRETGNGAPGGRGFPGGAGTAGAPGGDSMSIAVEIPDAKNLSLRYEILPGLGGTGGPGGPGGPGGLGGPPGNRDSGGRCRAASFGPRGPDGHPGPAGGNGTTGVSRPVCLTLNGSKIGDC